MLYSAGIGQSALDRLSNSDNNPNSVFTRKLLPLLEAPGTTQVTLAKKVQREVSALARTVNHTQQPAFYDQIIGEIELSSGIAATANNSPQQQPKPPVSTGLSEKEAFQLASSISTTEAWDTFLMQFPSGALRRVRQSR